MISIFFHKLTSFFQHRLTQNTKIIYTFQLNFFLTFFILIILVIKTTFSIWLLKPYLLIIINLINFIITTIILIVFQNIVFEKGFHFFQSILNLTIKLK